MESRLKPLKARYDAVLLDLDGTLLDGRAQLTPRAEAAVQRLKDAGLLVLICTGRSVPGTRAVHAALGLDTPVVAFNGCWIGRPGSAPERCVTIPNEVVSRLGAAESRAHFFFRQHAERKYTVVAAHEHYDRVARWYQDVVILDSPAGLPGEDLMRVSCFYSCRTVHEEAWGALGDDVRAHLHRESFTLNIFPEFEDTDLILAEVQAKGGGKAEALRWLEARHGIPRSRVIAVGDQQNDLSMLREAGLAVGMANATPDVKAVAHLLIGHHAKDGFAEWVEAGAPLPDPARSR
jgi:hydroxymethylpyrimidine pyrophosphatase-like HAD family hydrolase